MYIMKIKSLLLLLCLATISFVSCKKDSPIVSIPAITFANSILEGTANASGEFELKGHISSATRLEQVTLTKEGQSTAFIVDNSTAKNKNEYDFVYQVTGITANTYIIISITDQAGGNKTERYLIKK
jgi:hypothetical protein